MVKPWTYPLAVFALCGIFLVAINGARQGGIEEGIRQERSIKAEHDKVMRDVGTCDWAKVVAKSIQCERQLP
jgi:hypothetical protein